MRILFLLLTLLTASCALLEGPVIDNSIDKDMERGISSRFDLKGSIKFNHKLHYDDSGFACTKCHGDDNPEGGKIKGYGFQFAFMHCVGCHKNLKHAPKACDGCHEMEKLPKGFSLPK